MKDEKIKLRDCLKMIHPTNAYLNEFYRSLQHKNAGRVTLCKVFGKANEQHLKTVEEQ